MKNLLPILFFFLSFHVARAQVAAPELRCLEVINANGDVKLTWLPASDPQGVFFGYEVYFSSSATGPFTPITPVVSGINTSTFVHTTTVTTAQSLYYYICSRSGPTGATLSAPSETLRTIFLNINTALNDALKLMYNELHVPALASSSPNFTISREYPTGTWTDISKTPQTFYNDTLSICNSASLVINYLVTLHDNSGCVSGSNLQGGVYHDIHPPYEPEVDSISVLPNGNTVLAWHYPVDKDVIKYEIQRKLDGLNKPVDVLNGINNTSYTLQNTAALTGTVGLYVKAIDSCLGGSVVDYAPTTMFLDAYYNYCTFETLLLWNDYKWEDVRGTPRDQVLEYRIYYSTDSGATYQRLGKSTSPRFVHKNVDTEKHISYFVRVVAKKKAMTASSNRTHFFSGQVPAPDFSYIRAATIIKKNTIEVHFYIDPHKPSKGMEVERSEDGSEYINIGFLPFTGSPTYSILDEKVETGRKYYYYRAKVRDSCGNIRSVSNVARSILLKVEPDTGHIFLKHLDWSEYIGFNAGVKNYLVFRAVNDVGAFEQVGTTDSATTFFTDNIEEAAPLGAKIEYLVKAEEAYGNIYGLADVSFSNYMPAYMDGRLFVPNAFAPEGKNKTWKPITHFIDRREFNVIVYNRWGQVVFENGENGDAWDGAGCPNDVYIYHITYKNSRAEYETVTGSVMLIR